MTTIDKLNTLAGYHFQKDAIELVKRELLDSVKVPEEIQAIVSGARARILAAENPFYNQIKAIDTETLDLLSAVVIPDEIKAQLAEIDAKRKAITEAHYQRTIEIQRASNAAGQRVQSEIDAQVAGIYAEINTRKAEIEAEFSGQQSAVDDNIKALEDEIREDTKAEGKTVKGKYFMAVYVKGRTSWNTDMLDGMIAIIPDIAKARTIGAPSITIRKA